MFNNRRNGEDLGDHFVSGMSAAELARAAGIKVAIARDWLIGKANRGEIHATRIGSRRGFIYLAGPAPKKQHVRMREFIPYKAPASTVIPVRAGNRPAPDASTHDSPRWMV